MEIRWPAAVINEIRIYTPKPCQESALEALSLPSLLQQLVYVGYKVLFMSLVGLSWAKLMIILFHLYSNPLDYTKFSSLRV